MNKQIVSAATALAIAAAGGLAYAQSTTQGTDNASGVEIRMGDKARDDGGVPGVEANVGADGDQRNVNTGTLGAGPDNNTTDAQRDTSTLGAGGDPNPYGTRADRN